MKRNELNHHIPRITHLSAEGNYTFAHFRDAPSQLFARTLVLCADELAGFIRIHRKYAVNPAFISAIEVNQDKAEAVVNGKRLPISRRLLKQVQQVLANPDRAVRPEQPQPRKPHYQITSEAYRFIDLTWK